MNFLGRFASFKFLSLLRTFALLSADRLFTLSFVGRFYSKLVRALIFSQLHSSINLQMSPFKGKLIHELKQLFIDL